MSKARILAVLAAALWLAAAPALAQSYTEAQLKAFVQATIKVQDIDRNTKPRIRSAPDEATAKKMQQEALDDMAKAIETEGLTVDQYAQIANAAKTDANLKQRLQAYMREAK